jgi:hypothetical protein
LKLAKQHEVREVTMGEIVADAVGVKTWARRFVIAVGNVLIVLKPTV